MPNPKNGHGRMAKEPKKLKCLNGSIRIVEKCESSLHDCLSCALSESVGTGSRGFDRLG